MKKIALIAMSLALLFSVTRGFAADDSAQKTITRTFNVEPGGQMTVDADQGDIEVLTGNQNTVEVVVERVATGSGAAKALKGHKVTFTQDGNKVRIQATSEKQSHGIFSWSHSELQVHFKITVPKRFNASLDTAGGDVSVTELRGTVDARSSGGNLNFRKIEGEVSGHTSGGNVLAEGCTEKVSVQSSGGNMTIRDFSGPSVQVDTSGGNVAVKGCAGSLQIKTSGGNIVIEGFTGPTVFADTSGGSISLAMEKQPTGNCTLRSSGGNISAKLPETVALNLAASTDGGSVSSDLPVSVEGKAREGHLEGKINGGGPVLALRTSGGDVRVKKE